MKEIMDFYPPEENEANGSGQSRGGYVFIGNCIKLVAKVLLYGINTYAELNKEKLNKQRNKPYVSK